MRIAVIAAMEEEMAGFRDILDTDRTVEHRGFAFHEGRLEGMDTVLLLSRVGKVNAAVGAALLMDHYSPDAVINTGSAGGFSEELNPGDLVLSTEVVHHDADAAPFGFEPGQVPFMPARYVADPRLLAAAGATVPEEGCRLHRGLIASGDSFVHEPAQVEAIRKRFPDVLAAEMEAAGVAQACHLFATPFLVARSVSDLVTREDNPMDFQEFLPLAARRSVALVRQIIRRLAEGF